MFIFQKWNGWDPAGISNKSGWLHDVCPYIKPSEKSKLVVYIYAAAVCTFGHAFCLQTGSITTRSYDFDLLTYYISISFSCCCCCCAVLERCIIYRALSRHHTPLYPPSLSLSASLCLPIYPFTSSIVVWYMLSLALLVPESCCWCASVPRMLCVFTRSSYSTARESSECL